jgi:sulfotransferase family protein
VADLRVIGAGLPRTGTHSLRVALKQLLGGECYHMSYVFERENVDVPQWQNAVDSKPVDWDSVLEGCTATCDWPSSVFWREQAEMCPDALIVLSVRDDPEVWWRSADRTVWPVLRNGLPGQAGNDWHLMVRALAQRLFGDGWSDHDVATAGYERWNADVVRSAPADRLLVWNAKQGWAPLCERLGLDVPDEPFPVTNTSEEWAARDEENARAASADGA